MPLGVSCHTAFLRGKDGVGFASEGSTKRASMKRWQTDLAISFAIEKVVVVVVVTILEGSFGSGIRFDWENLRDPRLLIASSDVKV
jgi:hypothetical protein